MNQLLTKGQKAKGLTSGVEYVVDRFLGGGGQGEVYNACLGSSGLAIKWYFSEQATAEQKAALDRLVSNGSPNEKFLWPIELVHIDGQPGFGYVMPLREPKFIGIIDLMKRRADPTFHALATAGMELADGYLHLHSKGFCYCDISFGNAFFDPATGHVLICDNDNVIINGGTPPISGTLGFMAPEIVRGEALPNTETDLFSLAVLLFYMFHTHHPLHGAQEAAIKCLDAAAMNRLYGSNAVFIFDPDNDENRPVSGLHDNALASWSIFPSFFRELFVRAFTKGIRDPVNGRVRESEWRSVMVRLRDSIIPCQNCGAENFYDIEVVKRTGGQINPCWACNQQVAIPARIRIDKQLIMLNADTKLYHHHINNIKAYDFSKPVAEVSQNPSNPNMWGLRNVSGEKWVATLSDGTLRDVDPGRSVALSVGTQINFGSKTGEFRL